MIRRSSITIDKSDLASGWAYNPIGGVLPVEGTRGQFGQSSVISFRRASRAGHIAPGELFAACGDAGTRVTELALNGAVGSNGEAYVYLRNARLVRFGVLDNVIDANYDVSMSGTHAAHILQTTDYGDSFIVKDRATTPGEYVVRFWTDDVDADAGIVKTDGTAQDDDWFSTRTGSGVLTKGVPLKGCQGPQGLIAFTHGEYVGTIDITGDITDVAGVTTNRTRLGLGVGWTATSLCFDQNYFYIVGYRTQNVAPGFTDSECRLWLWDGKSMNPNFIFDVPDNFVSAVHSDGSIVRIFTSGQGNMSRVFHFTGSKLSTPAFEYANSLFAPPRHGAVDVFQDLVHLGMNGANYKVATLESLGNGRDGFNIRCHANSSTTAIQDLGMLRDMQGNGFYVGVKTGTTAWKIMQWSVNTYYPGATLSTRIYPLGFRSETERMKLQFSQFGSGASLTVKFFTNYDSGSNSIFSRTFTNATLGTISTFSFPVSIPDLTSLWIQFTFDHVSTSDTAAILQSAELAFLYDDETAI